MSPINHVPPSRLYAPAFGAENPALTTEMLLDGRYLLSELLGRGGSAAVYCGTDLRLQRKVAVKIFHSPATEPTTMARQCAEMVFLAQLNHPNLVSIYDARVVTNFAGDGPGDRHTGDPHSYLVMEFVDGVSLAQHLSAAPMSLDESGKIGIAIAKALAAVHKLGLVHRDVKPANILLPADGAAKLTDFGIARMLNSAHLTMTAEVVGTPLYLSPEQATGEEAGPGTDIYSLGLVLLECVTGNPEFPGTPAQSAVARLMRHPQVPDTLPAPWPDLLRSMTSPVPAERPTADAVASTLIKDLQDRERSRTATTVTAAAAPPASGQDHPAVPGRHLSVKGPSSSAAPTGSRLSRALTVATCGLALAAMTAVIAVTPTGNGDPPAGPETVHVTTTETTTARAVPARRAAAKALPASTFRVEWQPVPAVTVVMTATATTTETTIATSRTNEPAMPETTILETDIPENTIPVTTNPATTSEFTAPSTATESPTPATSIWPSETDEATTMPIPTSETATDSGAPTPAAP